MNTTPIPPYIMANCNATVLRLSQCKARRPFHHSAVSMQHNLSPLQGPRSTCKLIVNTDWTTSLTAPHAACPAACRIPVTMQSVTFLLQIIDDADSLCPDC